MALGHEVVLPAHTAEHPPVFQLIRYASAQQGHGKCRVDEPRIEPLQAFELFLPV
ncbi:hypothetical protein D3C76_1436450 [compost metagenome]